MKRINYKDTVLTSKTDPEKLIKVINELTTQIDELKDQYKILQCQLEIEKTKNCIKKKKKEKTVNLEYIKYDVAKNFIHKYPFLTRCTVLKNDLYYKIRYRKNGYDKCFIGQDFDEVAIRAKQFICLRELCYEESSYKDNVLFNEIAEDWLYKIKQPQASKENFSGIEGYYKNNIKKSLGNKQVKNITSIDIQKFLDRFQKKTPRKALDMKNIIMNIMNYAIDNDVISVNPIKNVYLPKYNKKLGKALTKKDEKKFVENIRGNKYEGYLLKMLYSGARPGEIYGIKEDLENNTITIKNEKLKRTQKELFRTIPMFPKYKEIQSMDIREYVPMEALRKTFSEACPGYTLKDLRHTFTTRARECGIDNELVAIWTGHTLNNITSKVYTHFSMEFQQSQAKKLEY